MENLKKQNTISEKAKKIISTMQQNELTEAIIYKKIAKFAKGEKNKKTLLRLSDEELKHYEIWKEYTGKELKPQKGKIFKYTLIARLFGYTFAIKLMEKGEANAQDQYQMIMDEVPEASRIKEEEEVHENALIEILDEESLKYVGSMVLGLNDALVELTGSLAGFTFALQDTKLIAISGLIVGISATFSMAASEFLSARSEGRNDAFKSCTYTGVAYLVTVGLLIAPYLLLDNSQFIIAFIAMIAVVVMIILVFSYYVSVVQDQKFGKRFLEMFLISIGVAILSFGVGLLAKNVIGIEV